MSADLSFSLFEQQTTGLVILSGDEVILVADCTVSEDHGAEAQVTAYPRERRGMASDHIQPQQDKLSTTLVFSATPLLEEADPSRPVDAYERLRALMTQRELVTLITSLKVYESMALTSISAPRSSTQGNSVTIACSWVKVEAIDTQSVTVPASILAALTRPSGKPKDKSKDQAKPPSEAVTKARKKTTAQALFDMGGDAYVKLIED